MKANTRWSFRHGPSDFKAAGLADKVYAAGRLLKYRERGLCLAAAELTRAANFIKKNG